jgi:hypothetical protein
VPFLPDRNGSGFTKATTDFGELTAVWDTGSPVSILRKTHAPKANDSAVGESVVEIDALPDQWTLGAPFFRGWSCLY